MTSADEMKPKGTWEVRRKIAIPALGHAADGMVVEHALKSLPGVKRVQADPQRREVWILYDITAADYRGLERALEEAGFPPADGGWSRFKARWYQYTDINGRDNAAAPAPPCCSNPKGIVEKRRRN